MERISLLAAVLVVAGCGSPTMHSKCKSGDLRACDKLGMPHPGDDASGIKTIGQNHGWAIELPLAVGAKALVEVEVLDDRRMDVFVVYEEGRKQYAALLAGNKKGSMNVFELERNVSRYRRTIDRTSQERVFLVVDNTTSFPKNGAKSDSPIRIKLVFNSEAARL